MVAMAKGNSGSARWRIARWRIWVQGAFLLAWLDPLRLRLHTACAPVFHCYSCPLATFACPIGVLANFSALHALPMIAVGTLMVTGALFGTLICGWVCPFGLLQDLLARIPTPKFAIPSWMGFCRYAVLLGLVLAIPYFYGEQHPLFFCRLCPAGAVEGAVPNTISTFGSEKIDWPSATKLTILGLFLGTALFTWRPWCTLFCPLGAIYGLFNRISFFFVRYQPEACTDCNLCQKLCHYRGRSERRAPVGRCIRCLDCHCCQALSIGTVFGEEGQPQKLHNLDRS
jgi:ferredoxin-type protein NapH